MSSIFIVGAGFSHPAGLPLGKGLFSQVLGLARAHNLYDHILEPDIAAYLKYQRASKRISLSEDEIDFEDFVAYLDLEHFLWLQGKDTLTSAGNRSQMAIRNMIALILFERQQATPASDMAVYREFARSLRPWDCIISFNYDTLLETVFDDLGVKYRLVPDSLTSASEFCGTAKVPDEDVVLLKVHGSIDWFDRTEFEASGERFPGVARHPVFEHPEECDARPIADGTYYLKSPLRRVYRVKNLRAYFDHESFLLDCPLLVSPSAHKLLYLNPLREFWYGVSRIGYAETRMAIIGFSLPDHDEYLRLPLYHLVTNFQCSDKGSYPGYEPKTKLTMIDLRVDEDQKVAYRNTYKFVDWSKTTLWFEGFNKQALQRFFLES